MVEEKPSNVYYLFPKKGSAEEKPTEATPVQDVPYQLAEELSMEFNPEQQLVAPYPMSDGVDALLLMHHLGLIDLHDTQ